MSAQKPHHEEPSPLTRTTEGFVYTGELLICRITGLTSHNLERLRVTLKASCQSSVVSSQSGENKTDNCKLITDHSFHIDTLDLYHSRSRESFAESCTKYLKVRQTAVMAELSQLITVLEKERVTMRESGKDSEKVPPMTEEEKKEALEALKSKELLNILLTSFDALGYIGERENKLLGVLAGVSRLLPDPLALLFLSRPGAGKTQLQEAICKLIPPESTIQYTRLTGQSLFYRDKDALKHKVLAIEEEEGMQEAMYSIKTLISSQKLSVAATRTDAKSGKFSVDEYTVNGPVVVMVSTTNPDALDDETRQRFLILTIDETSTQTKKILQAQRSRNSERWYRMTSDEKSVTTLVHNMHRQLKPLTVVFPDDLKIFWPFGRLQMRREQGKFLSLIKSIVLLHQYRRKTGTLKRMDGTKMAYVLATQQDVELALELGRASFTRNVDDVSPTGRTLLREIVGFVNNKRAALRGDNPEDNDRLSLSQIPFTRKELRHLTGWSDTQVRRTCDHLAMLGYLGRVSGRQGAAYRYVLLDTGEDDPTIEFRMDELKKVQLPKKGPNGKSTT